MHSRAKSSVSYEILYIIGIIAISFSSIFVRWSSAEVSIIAMYRLYLTNLLMLPRGRGLLNYSAFPPDSLTSFCN